MAGVVIGTARAMARLVVGEVARARLATGTDPVTIAIDGTIGTAGSARVGPLAFVVEVDRTTVAVGGRRTVIDLAVERVMLTVDHAAAMALGVEARAGRTATVRLAGRLVRGLGEADEGAWWDLDVHEATFEPGEARVAEPVLHHVLMRGYRPVGILRGARSAVERAIASRRPNPEGEDGELWVEAFHVEDIDP